MDLMRSKEDFDSLDSQNVDILTNNMKIACPVLDNLEHISSVTESNSDHLKDNDDRELSQSQENSFDKIARRPVETWKYLPFKIDGNRTSYKCSLCCSVYQHKKSLNKHWKDKHLANNATSSSIPMQERVVSNVCYNQPINNNNDNHGEILYPTVGSTSNQSLREIYVPQNYEMVSRKRLSLQSNDENKENCSALQPKRLSLMPMQSLVMRGNRSLCNLRAFGETSSNILDLRKPDTEALDLRTSKLYNEFVPKLRCFQCVFHSHDITELNEHFKHLHVSILLGVKSFCLPVNVYQKLLINQFTAIVRTESEPLEPFNGPIQCCLCACLLPSRYEMIQHIGIAHEMEMVWVCLVCGYGCRFPGQLSQHFLAHTDIQMSLQPLPQQLTQESLSVVADTVHTNVRCSTIDFSSPTPDSHLAASTPNNNNKYKRIISRKEIQLSVSDSNNCSGKEKPLKCLVCDATARWRSELFTHMITHSEHRSFGCKFCSYRSKWKWDVPKHLKRCRMAPASVRKPDVQNSFLITLLQHYSPPPGDILHEFMKQYNIKDIGSLNKPMNIKMENEDHQDTAEQSSSTMNIESKLQSDENDGNSVNRILIPNKYEMISDCSDDGELDVGTDHFDDNNTATTDRSEQSLKCSFKKCPWCPDFLTNKPSELSSHLAQHHADGNDTNG